MNSFYSIDELKDIGLKQFGDNVLISKKASIYNAPKIKLGNNVRVDDFCILSGKIEIGNFVHISAYSGLFAGETGISMGNFSGLSSKVVIYAESDDYSGEFLTNPMIPFELRNVTTGMVKIGKHVIVGTGSSIMPGVCIGEGAAIGAMSLVNKNVYEWTINIGIPSKKIKNRSKNLLGMEGTLEHE